MPNDASPQGEGQAEGARGALALWYEAPGRASLRTTPLPDLEPRQALVRTLYSGVSRGTERLVFSGAIPPSEYESMRAPLQDGAFPFPVKYGYCAVGVVENGPADWVGRNVFALHPHQSAFVADVSTLRPLPHGLCARRATLAANMETALNALWDSGAGPGDRIVVVGAGVVGLLVGYLCAGLPGADVTIVDLDPARAALAQSFGAHFVSVADWAQQGVRQADVVFHASASAPGLALALGAAGLEASVVEVSWYGAGDVPAPLGGAFHSKRLRLVSTQVGQVSPSRRPRWDYARRMAKAMELLADDRLDALIDREVAFADMPETMAEIFAPGAKGLGIVVRY